MCFVYYLFFCSCVGLTTESDEDLEPFERLARNMEDLTGDGGVMKKVHIIQ